MPDALWTSDEIVQATGGKLAGKPFAAGGVSIDTRSLEPGDLFVALGGVRDGHEFVGQAMEQGAAGALASRQVFGSAVMVADTLQALERLGVAARERAVKARRGAVTGSVGKTSVTQAIMAGLTLAGHGRQGSAHSSVKSYNNHIGVPLTLARMPAATERAVFEIGMNHAGEIGPLTRMVRPHAAVVTTVGPVHTENFPDGETGVAHAKAEIFQGLQAGGIAVLNADDRWFSLLKSEAEKVGAQVRTFGRAEGCDARLIDFQGADGHAVVQARFHGEGLDFPILQTGFHWGLNAMAVLLMLEALDVSLSDGLAALGAFEPLQGRGAETQVTLAKGGFTLIDESYNANPISMASAIATLGARRTSGRKLVALTDMLELGPQASGFHAALAQPLEAAKADLVFAAGPLMKSLWDALPSTRRGGYARTAAELAPLVARTVEPGDVVMVKGSNGSKAGLIAQALRSLDVRPGEAG
ncbi:MAG TPA: UDP-N-acetylmuramoyl-tripeptide--D-alanyl-D-alanine ligase [Phenylobacterium sp.]|jgi:UDP-N-acetylmuramoyl-tripeptide--D-alanyl-D-alanine ligase|uniref:UDP-N-acetylmuramoyl-tripeptide--D-alanyl-D- alanine ligase n=1 Tax=Phenylobacterium sp. TaxID=1871053 RepID=UPI002D298FC5|nr:UDP-N-acetylmuramoyl-tripeptide--D-alanyl-D-alanine ligase [Phenylobacterium sp.]HZZ67022.1 UDP-N-acetylmuramoyl-tripeptide--D-alanyl-D-alanine ligase [Phenylobacterium sp.]